MKNIHRILALLLALALCLSFCPVVFAANSEEAASDDEKALSRNQLEAVNVANYVAVLAEEINSGRDNRAFLESAYSALFNNLTYKSIMDNETKSAVMSLIDTIHHYLMIDIKRDRLRYIREQNQAKAIRSAIPNPVSLLNTTLSGDPLKAVVSVLYMAADSKTSYENAKAEADRQFVEAEWELDDASAKELHNSSKNIFGYMRDIVIQYGLPEESALYQDAIKDFISWSSKPDAELIRKIEWFESHKNIYGYYGTYWLELAKDYYLNGEYEKCLSAVTTYESVSTGIFRHDKDYASILPMAIVSARETMSEQDYVEPVNRYCEQIKINTKDEDCNLRYFAAQMYLDLYRITNDDTYLEKAYSLVNDNVNYLIDEQRHLNDTYTNELQYEKKEVKKGASDREKAEAKEYNKEMDAYIKSLKNERKTALPPVSEALYLNCELLFALAEKRGLSDEDKSDLDRKLHENGEPLFLTKLIEEKFWFDHKDEKHSLDETAIEFDGQKLTIPAVYLTDRAEVTVIVDGANGKTVIDDWTVSKVDRPKKGTCDDFTATLKSKEGKDYKYQAGENVMIQISLVPVDREANKDAENTIDIEISYRVVAAKKAGVFYAIEFERIAS